MNVIQKFIAKRVLGLTQKRQFSGASNGRLYADWNVYNTPFNNDLNAGLNRLRARSRDLARNNDYFASFLRLAETNVVGHKGVKFQSVVANKEGVKNDRINDEVEYRWHQWCKKEYCTVTGKLTWVDACKLFVRSVLQDGEVIIRYIYSGDGVKIQFIEPDLLDETYSERKSSGGDVVMGIERDKFGKPVAYYFKSQGNDPFQFYYPDKAEVTGGRIRVPAKEIIHEFFYERISQARGVPHSHSAMAKLQMLAGYEEAELVGARVASSQMAFITPDKPETFTGDLAVDPIVEVEPGSIRRLQAGDKVDFFDPNHPSNNYMPFTKTLLRSIASSWGISYNTLTSDLENVSFSTVRAGIIQERDFWRCLQSWMVDHFCQPIFETWLLHETLPFTLSRAHQIQIQEPVWTPRGFAWVDPLKDVDASLKAIQGKLTSRNAVIAEQEGSDFYEVAKQIADEERVMKGFGLDAVTVAQQMTEATNLPETPDNDLEEESYAN